MLECTDLILRIILADKREDKAILVERGVKEEIGSYGALERAAGYGKFQCAFAW